jgi:hypothetical protein
LALALPLVLCQCVPIIALFGLRGVERPIESGKTVDRDAALILVGFEQRTDYRVYVEFTRIDPATGAPIGNCWHWDRFVFEAAPGSVKRRTYRLFEVPPGTYASQTFGWKKRYADRNDAREWFVGAVPGQVSYLGDFVIDADGVLDVEWAQERAAAALRRDFPNLDATVADRKPTRTMATTMIMCAP